MIPKNNPLRRTEKLIGCNMARDPDPINARIDFADKHIKFTNRLLE